MCGPAAVAIATLIVTAVSAGVSYYQADTNARNQAHYQNKVQDATHKNAMSALEDQVTQSNIAKQQAEQDAYAQMQATLQEIASERGTAQSILAAGNMGGSGVAATMQQYAMMETQAKIDAANNAQFMALQTSYDLKAARADAQRQIIGGMASPVAKPFIGSYLLSAGSSMLGTYDNYMVNSGGYKKSGSSQVKGA